MNDKVDRLRAAIADLERELHGLEESDPETRALLREAAADISQALHRPSSDTDQAADPPQPADSNSRNLLEQKMLEFEASHPQVSAALSRFIDMLGQIGI
jgi:uncharacterized protein YukE